MRSATTSVVTTISVAVISALLFVGCSHSNIGSNEQVSLSKARDDFRTQLRPQLTSKDPAESAPLSIFSTNKYRSPVGLLTAYVTPDPGDRIRHPAIIWITGGDCNSIGDVWSPAPPDNDQTASSYREAGIVMMFPSLRGGNDNPGTKEGFLGEVNDVLAAAEYLEALPYVDPQRIFLGGHSTGGTLALLVAESTDRFRAVFSFGPAGDVAGYGTDSGFLPFDISNEDEVRLRSPGYWLASVKSPVWIIEGASGSNNMQSLEVMEKLNRNPLAHFVAVPGHSHFSVLKPANDTIAKKIVQDKQHAMNIDLTQAEITRTTSQ